MGFSSFKHSRATSTVFNSNRLHGVVGERVGEVVGDVVGDAEGFCVGA